MTASCSTSSRGRSPWSSSLTSTWRSRWRSRKRMCWRDSPNSKRQNVLRQISAIFDTRRLGYKTTLVAMAYGPDKLHRAAMEINRHPGVSHNYAREGSYYNLWFTPRGAARTRPGGHGQPHGAQDRGGGVPDHADHPVLQDRRELRHGEPAGLVLQLQPPTGLTQRAGRQEA